MSHNPLLDDIDSSGAVAATSIALPTLGRFYAPGVLQEGTDVTDVPVAPISALDETTFSDPFLLATGKALDLMIRKVCPSVLEPTELAEVDVAAILLATRLISGGPTMKLSHTCSNPETHEVPVEGTDIPALKKVCQQENEFVLDLLEFIQRFAPLSFMDRFELELPRLGQVVQLRPTPYWSSFALMKKLVHIRRAHQNIPEHISLDEIVLNGELSSSYAELVIETQEASLDTQITTILFVRARSGAVTHDPDHLREWFMRLPMEEVALIRERITELDGKLKEMSQVEYACPSCGFANVFPLILDEQKLFTRAVDLPAPEVPTASSKTTGKKGKTSSRVSRK